MADFLARHAWWVAAAAAVWFTWELSRDVRRYVKSRRQDR
jgi:hypothetical protein